MSSNKSGGLASLRESPPEEEEDTVERPRKEGIISQLERIDESRSN